MERPLLSRHVSKRKYNKHTNVAEHRREHRNKIREDPIYDTGCARQQSRHWVGAREREREHWVPAVPIPVVLGGWLRCVLL